MKNGGTIRILIALALIGAIFSGGSEPRPPKPEPCVVVPVEPYTGTRGEYEDEGARRERRLEEHRETLRETETRAETHGDATQRLGR